MIEKRRYSYTVLPREVDSSKRATIMTLGDYILHTAGEDADRNGFGVEKLQQSNMTWVLSRIAIEMKRFPVQHENYTIETWIENVGRLMTTRNFIIRDADGKVIGCASTYWAMIDFTTRQPLDLRKNIEYADAANPEPCPIDKPIKVPTVCGNIVERHKVKYSDIDFNCHANSMKYVEWMIDILPFDKLTNKKLSRFDINFIHETRFGEEVDIVLEQVENIDRFELKRSDGTAVCRAQFVWNNEA